MQEQIEAFKNEVRQAAAEPGFVHHAWFAQYHLELVERIAVELLDIYPKADRDLVIVMVWLHDYGKLLDFEHQYEKTLTEGPKTLVRLGFAPDFAKRAVDYIGILDRKLELDLHEAPLEVQIVSSADAASHFVGPFMPVHWKENPDLSVEELMAKQRRKVAKDWDRKMVLPEVRRAFARRRRVVLEQAGELPEKFLA